MGEVAVNDLSYAVDAIRQSVSAVDAGTALGLNPDRYGRCACPIHGGKNRNFKLYAGERGFHCFVCGASGDVIKLVRDVNRCSFPEALGWLNSEFALGLDLNHEPDRNAREAARKAREDKLRREREDHETMMLALDELADTERRLGDLADDIRQYQPTDRNAQFDGRYVQAVRQSEKTNEYAWHLRSEIDKLKNRK